MAPAHVIADRFEVESLAGTGGGASVYRAKDRFSGETVALKLLRGEPDSESIERFALEAKVLAQLSHPGIVRYVTHGRDGGDVFLAMEWLDGVTLAQSLAKKKMLGIDESIALIAKIAEALGVAHAQGIVHRDIKPANIFLEGGDPTRVKLLDFGIARLRSRLSDLTMAGVVIGTPGYMAPEQARADRTLDARADVFSLGCVLFRCLTGRNAFAGGDIVAVLAKILLEEAPLVRTLRADVPGAIERLLADMLAKRPIERPIDANAVRAQIESLGPKHDALVETTHDPPSLSSDERRMMCILLTRPPIDAGGGDRVDGETPPRARAVDGDTLRDTVASQGGRLEVLANRSLLVSLEGAGTPTDNAARAARCALAMRARLPNLPMVLVAGEGEMKGKMAVGPVIDRGAALLATISAGDGVRLDEVIAGLLDGRFEVESSGFAISLRGERDAPSMTRTFLGRPSACVGRERDLAMLDAIWDECVEESVARIVLVTGAAGIGKSRLFDEFLRKVNGGETHAQVLTGRGDPMSAKSPFGMIADPIRHAAGIRRGEPSAERQLKLYTRISRSVGPDDAQRVTVFLAEIIGTPFLTDESVELHAARHDPQLMGDQMRRAWEDWLDAEAAKGPILLVLEDLHWGDLPSVEFVDAAARHLQNKPFMVLALARPEVYQSFPNLWKERSLTELRLGRLTDKAAKKLVEDALGASVNEDTVSRIIERGDGNAFFLEELIRAVVAGKGEALPSTVLAMVQARLGALSVEARRFLRAASVFGKMFSTPGVVELLGEGGPPPLLHDWLSELVAKDIIHRPAETRFQGELVFHHALIHEAAYSMLTEADRALGHRLAAEWLEKGGEADPVVLAEHFERGGERLRASGWYRRAAEQALGGNDHASAIQRVEKAIACGARGEDEGALRLIESEARRWRGDNEGARVAAIEAMKLLPRGGARWCDAASELAAVAGSRGDTVELVGLASELEKVEPIGSASELVNALSRAARPLFWAGKHALASQALARARAFADASSIHPTALAAHLMASGVEARLLGDPSECVRCNERAVLASESAGDLRGGCVERGNLGYAYLEIGANAEAEHALGEALATAARFRLPLVVATAQQNLGVALGRRGAWKEAIELEKVSLATFEAQADLRRGGCSLLYLAVIEAASGALDDAERSATRAIEMLAGAPPVRANALAVLAGIELARGDVDRAADAAAEAHALLIKLGGIDEGEARIRLANAETLGAAGDVEGARAAMAAALRHLQARAAKIQDEARRRDFLGAIPENARTMELARDWGLDG